jgi:curved DNA-binding protein CbpA
MEQILALSPNLDATELSLSAAEGYLLSRIDGATPWRLLREMGGIPANEVDAVLTRWLQEGVLDVIGGAPPTKHACETASAEAPVVEALTAAIDERQLDESLDLALDTQRRILEFESCLGIPYAELLGVEPGSDAKVVKRAYFKLSKEFHPDRYFRREIGSYAQRLDRIFKKVLEAHEMLSDPKLCEVENRVDDPGRVAALVTASADAVAPETPPLVEAAPLEEAKAAPRSLTKLERLRQRMPFKIDPVAIAGRRAKAREIFRAACVSQQGGRFQEAESSIRIAISFDPVNTEFKEALGALRLEAAGNRATKLLAAPSDRMSDSDLREALTLLEDVLIYRPHDPQLNDRAARVCLQLRKLDLAVDYAQTLIERCPEDAEHHALLGQIFREQDKTQAAVREFELALKCDEDNLAARRALAALRIGHHDAVQGGAS